MHLNPFAISGILISIALCPLAFLVMILGKTKVTKIFSLHLLSASIWGLGSIIIGLNRNPNHSLAIQDFAGIGVIFMPATLYHTVYLLRQLYNIKILIIAYGLSIYFLYTLLSHQMFRKVIFMFNSLYIPQGEKIFFPFYIFWIFFIGLAHFNLISYYRTSYPEQRKQIQVLIWCIPIIFGVGSLNFLPYFGIALYPYCNFVVALYALFLAYAILRFQFLDIEIVIKKSIVYSILIAFISIAYLILVVFTERLFQSYFGYQSITFTIFTAFFIGVLFIPLRNRIQSLVDRLFFQKSPTEMAEEINFCTEKSRRPKNLKMSRPWRAGWCMR